MGTRFFLHIGANKTGSSAIQDFLRLNWQRLRELGYLVPDHKMDISEKVAGQHVFALQDIMDRQDNESLAAKVKALMASDAKTVIISAENLSNGTNFNFFWRCFA